MAKKATACYIDEDLHREIKRQGGADGRKVICRFERHIKEGTTEGVRICVTS